MNLDEYVQLACIPDAVEIQNMRSFLTVNQTAFAIGWSVPVQWQNRQFQRLFNFQMYIFDNSYCTEILRTKGDIQGVFCAGICLFNK